MDETDLYLISKLSENSRLTYRELAKRSNISVSAIHKRINKLTEGGIIEAFVARPSIIALKSLLVIIYGTSKAKTIDIVSNELGQHENITFVGITGQKSLHVYAFLRDISELQELSSFVSKTAQISKPLVGIVNIPYITTPEPLTTIDYKIIKTLNRDARKPISEIAEDLGLSPKTVKKRLDRMIENNLVSFTIEWMPTYYNSFVIVFHITLNEGIDLISTIQKITEKYSKNMAYCYSFSNIPNFFTLHTCTKSAQDSHNIQKELETEGFKDIVPHIYLTANYYDCWVDQLLRSK